MNQSRLSRVIGGLAGALLLLHAALAWWLRVPGLTSAQDDARYLLLARALRHLSYTQLFLVGQPVESLYPPVYPLGLALAGLLPFDPVSTGIALNVLFSTAALAVLFALVSAWSTELALLVLAAAAVNPMLVSAAGSVASEPLFMLLSFLVLLVTLRSGATPRGRALAGALAIAAALTRSIGVVLILSLLLVWMYQRQWRAVGWLVLASALTVGTWLTWTAIAPAQLAGQSYLGDAVLVKPAPEPPHVDPEPAAAESQPPAEQSDSVPATAATTSHPSMLTTLVTRIGNNLPGYGVRGIPQALDLPTLPGVTVDNWFWLLVLGVLGVAGLWSLTLSQPTAVIYLAGYAGILLIWPYRLGRFLTPVLPLLIMVLLLGAWRLLRRRGGAVAWVLPAAFAGVIVVTGAANDAGRWRAVQRCDRSAPYYSAGCYDPRLFDFFAAVADLERRVPRDAILLTPKAATVYYLTGRRAVSEVQAATLDAPALDRFLRGQRVDYVLLSRIHFDQWVIAGTLRGLCRSLELVSAPNPDALLLRVVPEGTASGEGCAAIDRFVAGPWRE